MIRTIPAVGFAALATLVASTALAQAPAPAPAPMAPTTTTVTPPGGAVASTGGAGAAAPATVGKVSAALLLGNGFKDGYNIGLGARGGYTLPMNVYIGGTFVYHLGKSEDFLGYTSSVKVMYFGAEGGYDIAAGPAVIRPYAGLGLASISVTLPACTLNPVTFQQVCSDSSESQSKIAFWPGVTGEYMLGNAFIGADARFVLVSDTSGFALFLTGGMLF